MIGAGEDPWESDGTRSCSRGGSANRPGYLSAVLTGLRCVEQPHQQGINGSFVHYALRLHELL
jgi:hypothetical protein